MIIFNKKDIPVLDFIIEKSIEKYPESIYLIDLIDSGFIIQKSKTLAVLFSDEIDEFERLIFIISKYDCADCKIIPPHIYDKNSSVTKNFKTIQFKSQGGFKKAYKDLKKPLDWYKIIPIILTLISGSLTIYFAKLNYDLKENQSDILIERDSLKVHYVDLSKLVDSLTIENKLQSDKLRLQKTELIDTTKTD